MCVVAFWGIVEDALEVAEQFKCSGAHVCGDGSLNCIG
jgi:hypothetical protein